MFQNNNRRRVVMCLVYSSPRRILNTNRKTTENISYTILLFYLITGQGGSCSEDRNGLKEKWKATAKVQAGQNINNTNTFHWAISLMKML